MEEKTGLFAERPAPKILKTEPAEKFKYPLAYKYRITDEESGEAYIGVTTKDPLKKWSAHLRLVEKAGNLSEILAKRVSCRKYREDTSKHFVNAYYTSNMFRGGLTFEVIGILSGHDAQLVAAQEKIYKRTAIHARNIAVYFICTKKILFVAKTVYDAQKVFCRVGFDADSLYTIVTAIESNSKLYNCTFKLLSDEEYKKYEEQQLDGSNLTMDDFFLKITDNTDMCRFPDLVGKFDNYRVYLHNPQFNYLIFTCNTLDEIVTRLKLNKEDTESVLYVMGDTEYPQHTYEINGYVIEHISGYSGAWELFGSMCDALPELYQKLFDKFIEEATSWINAQPLKSSTGNLVLMKRFQSYFLPIAGFHKASEIADLIDEPLSTVVQSYKVNQIIDNKYIVSSVIVPGEYSSCKPCFSKEYLNNAMYRKILLALVKKSQRFADFLTSTIATGGKANA